jgi:hypothetical protein
MTSGPINSNNDENIELNSRASMVNKAFELIRRG